MENFRSWVQHDVLLRSCRLILSKALPATAHRNDTCTYSLITSIATSKGQTAKDFIDLIEEHVGNQDVRIILADRYPAINSTEAKQYLNEKNILLVFTAINNASANGINERANQTFVNRIRCNINGGDRRAWTSIAAECVGEYNRTDHSVTKFAPDYIMLGKTSDIVPVELIEQHDLHKDRSEALRHTIEDFERNKRRIDRLRKEESFKVVDRVFVENGNPMNRAKLDEVRIGPFSEINGSQSTYMRWKPENARRKPTYSTSASSEVHPLSEEGRCKTVNPRLVIDLTLNSRAHYNRDIYVTPLIAVDAL